MILLILKLNLVPLFDKDVENGMANGSQPIEI